MPRVDFPGAVSAEVKVSGRSVTDAPPTTLPVGPRAFPPPPPPPPVPLMIESISVVDFLSVLGGYAVKFTAPAFVVGVPNWTLDVTPPAGAVAVQDSDPGAVILLVTAADSSFLTVPADATGVLSASGGVVTPGVYPLPYPPP